MDEKESGTALDHGRIQELIEQLDAAVPRDDAAVLIPLYVGGPDESYIVANQRGYLRMGIEFLKAAYAEPVPENRRGLPTALDELVLPDSDVHFGWLDRRDGVPLTAAVNQHRTWDWPAVAGVAFFLVVMSLLAIGASTVIRWIFG